MPAPELLDLQIIHELVGVTADSGNTFMQQLLQSFAVDAHGALERMQQHARRGDSAALAREAHRLRGSSGTVGAVRLAGECLAIERSARAGSCGALESSIERALDVLDATRNGMTEFFRGTIAGAA